MYTDTSCDMAALGDCNKYIIYVVTIMSENITNREVLQLRTTLLKYLVATYELTIV